MHKKERTLTPGKTGRQAALPNTEHSQVLDFIEHQVLLLWRARQGKP